jgi:outer membrane lipoprotein-sorting protein
MKWLQKKRSWEIAVVSLIALGTLMFLPFRADAIDPNSTDARAIVQAAEDEDRGDKTIGRAKMVISDASGRTRERTFLQKGLKFKGGEKMILFFESPADVRNTGFLTINYDADKDDDQWLYLPSLKKTTRISSSGKKGAFMGSDIAYADLASRKVDDYTYSIIEQSVKVDGEDCWLIEAKPKSSKTIDETGYVKMHQWISKSKLLPIQGKAWVKEGRKLKYLKNEDIKKVDGVWVPHKLTVRTVKNGKVESTTVLSFLSVKLNQASVNDAEFTERRLEQGI